MFSPKMMILSAVLLMVLAFRFGSVDHNTSNYVNGQMVGFTTTLLSNPQISGKYQKFFVNPEGGGKVLVVSPRYPEFSYGETVSVSGTLQNKALNNERIVTTMFLPKIERVKNDKNMLNFPLKSALAILISFRQNIITLFEKTLPPASSSLLLGIVFGIKEGMPKDFAENVRIAGVMHIIAASGMNITMVGGFLSAVFAVFFRRQIALLASIAGILLYAVMAGLEPSIIRAAIMGILVFSSQITGRQALSLYLLFFAAYAMLFISPELISDIGFQLSFISTLGLLYIKPLFEKGGLKRVVEKSIVGEDITTTVSAQLAALPILLVNFGSYSLWSVVVNALVLWTIPILMVLGGIGALIGIFIQPLGQIFLYLSLPFLLYMEKMVSFFADAPIGAGAVVNIEGIPWQMVLGYYFFLGSIIFYLNKKSVGGESGSSH